MKKILAILLTVAALCLSMMTVTSAAGTALTLKVTSGDYVVGSNQPITLEVSITGNPGLAGIQLHINKPVWAYVMPKDKTTGRADSVVAGPIWDAGYVQSPSNENADHIIVNIYGAEVCCTGDGVICTITVYVDESKINKDNANQGFSFITEQTYGVGDPDEGMPEVHATLPTAPTEVEVTCTKHDYKWEHDATQHWQVCQVCGDTTAKENHDEDSKPTCQKGGECKTCGYQTSAPDPDAHVWGEWIEDTAATCQKKATHHHKCTLCGTESEPEEYGDFAAHTPGDKWESDGENHWKICTVCGKEVDKAAHTNAVKSDADNHWNECTVCAHAGTKSAHTYATVWTTDATSHKHVCTLEGCGQAADEELHKDVAQFVPEKAATSKEQGNVPYWYCATCGKYFADNNGAPYGPGFDTVDNFLTAYKKDCSSTGHRFVAVPIDDNYHMLICLNQCGTVIPAVPHNFSGFEGRCVDCGYAPVVVDTPVTGDTTGDVLGADVEAPTDTTTQNTDTDDETDVGDTEPEAPAKEENPKTGVALSVIPALLAAAVVVTRKH